MLKIALSALVLLMLLPLGALSNELPPLTHGLTRLDDGGIAPDLALLNLDDEEIRLSDYRGQVVVINFWATWCPPCRREMPSLERLQRALGGQEVKVIAVNVGENFEDVFTFLGSVDPSPSFEILFDGEAATMQSWSVLGLPTTYVVAPDGRLVYRAVGGREFDHPEIVKQLAELAR